MLYSILKSENFYTLTLEDLIQKIQAEGFRSIYTLKGDLDLPPHTCFQRSCANLLEVFNRLYELETRLDSDSSCCHSQSHALLIIFLNEFDVIAAAYSNDDPIDYILEALHQIDFDSLPETVALELLNYLNQRRGEHTHFHLYLQKYGCAKIRNFAVRYQFSIEMEVHQLTAITKDTETKALAFTLFIEHQKQCGWEFFNFEQPLDVLKTKLNQLKTYQLSLSQEMHQVGEGAFILPGFFEVYKDKIETLEHIVKLLVLLTLIEDHAAINELLHVLREPRKYLPITSLDDSFNAELDGIFKKMEDNELQKELLTTLLQLNTPSEQEIPRLCDGEKNALIQLLKVVNYQKLPDRGEFIFFCKQYMLVGIVHAILFKTPIEINANAFVERYCYLGMCLGDDSLAKANVLLTALTNLSLLSTVKISLTSTIYLYPSEAWEQQILPEFLRGSLRGRFSSNEESIIVGFLNYFDSRRGGGFSDPHIFTVLSYTFLDSLNKNYGDVARASESRQPTPLTDFFMKLFLRQPSSQCYLNNTTLMMLAVLPIPYQLNLLTARIGLAYDELKRVDSHRLNPNVPASFYHVVMMVRWKVYLQHSDSLPSNEQSIFLDFFRTLSQNTEWAHYKISMLTWVAENTDYFTLRWLSVFEPFWNMLPETIKQQKTEEWLSTPEANAILAFQHLQNESLTFANLFQSIRRCLCVETIETRESA